MAFQFTDQGVPYHQPVEPIVPKPDNTAAAIISAGTKSAVEAFIHMASIAKQAQIAREEMLQSADLHAKQLGFEEEKLGQDYKLRSRAMDLEDKFRGDASDRAWDLLDHQEKNLDAMAAVHWNSVTTQINDNKKRAEVQNQFNTDANDLGVYDETKWTNDPQQTAFNALALQRMYGSSTDPNVKAAVSDVVNRAKSSKVGLNVDGKGVKQYPWIDVVTDMQQNADSSVFFKPLEDAGYLNVKTENQPPTQADKKGNTVQGDLSKRPDTTKPATTTITPSPQASKWLGIDYSKLNKIMPRVRVGNTLDDPTQKPVIDMGVQSPPPGMQDGGGATSVPINTGGYAPQTPIASARSVPTGTPTPSDQATILQQAKAAKALGKDPAAIKSILQTKGIDPALLDQ